MFRGWWRFLVIERVGLRRPSAVTEDDMKRREAMAARMERIELAMLNTAYHVSRQTRRDRGQS